MQVNKPLLFGTLLTFISLPLVFAAGVSLSKEQTNAAGLPTVTNWSCPVRYATSVDDRQVQVINGRCSSSDTTYCQLKMQTSTRPRNAIGCFLGATLGSLCCIVNTPTIVPSPTIKHNANPRYWVFRGLRIF